MIYILIYSLLNVVVADDYVIDKVDKIINRECLDCPGYVAESYIVTPVTESSGYKAKDLKFFGCHATLVDKNKVLLASHCARAWTVLDWKTLSNENCGLAAAFYFPKTAQFPAEKVRCRKIISPIYLKSGVPQLEPDHLYMELDRDVERTFATESNEPQLLNNPYFIWGFDSETKTFVKRTCQTLPAPSPLTPLSYNNSGSYQTLTCDGNLEQGWSGAGVFNSQHQIVGVVSFGFDVAGYGAGTFGMNEINISLSRCFSKDVSGPECFTDEATKLQFLIHVYALSIDYALIWQSQTISSLEKTFQGLRFEYTKYRESPQSILYFPAFKAKCIDAKLKQSASKVVQYAVGDINNINTNYFLFNDDSTPKGVIETPVDGIGGVFSLSFKFIKGPASALPDCSADSMSK
ncbi:hypothetical protein K2X05_01765 [bacterium]|nr:hypothetical protein [bacterium]